MLNAQLINQPWRENPRRECTTKDLGEFSVETTDPHVLELKVWLDDCVCGGALIGALDLDGGLGIFVECDVGMRGEDAPRGRGGEGRCVRREATLFVGELNDLNGFDDDEEFDVADVHNEALAGSEDLVREVLVDTNQSSPAVACRVVGVDHTRKKSFVKSSWSYTSSLIFRDANPISRSKLPK